MSESGQINRLLMELPVPRTYDSRLQCHNEARVQGELVVAPRDICVSFLLCSRANAAQWPDTLSPNCLQPKK